MYYCIYPQFDTFISEKHPERNSGIDQILELSKIAINSKDPDGDYWPKSYNTRILIKFNLSEISASLNSGQISKSAKYWLKLYTAHADNLPIAYDIYAYPLSQSWTNGNGNYNDSPEIKSGVSWYYRDGIANARRWNSGSNVGFSYQALHGGGNWYTGSAFIASQSFDYTSPDVRMNVTNLVKKWLSGSIVNNGMILKRTNLAESGSEIYGSIKFFSKDTHTIYIPRLEVVWNDTNQSGIGSFTQVSDTTQYTIYPKTLKGSYTENEIAKIYWGVRDRYPTKTYASGSGYQTLKRLPTSSYYSVRDYITDEVIIPYDTVSTKISCDTTGNYFKLRMNSFLPERYYKIQLRVDTDGGNTVKIADDGWLFKIRKG